MVSVACILIDHQACACHATQHFKVHSHQYQEQFSDHTEIC